ncbi:hypothetical protein R0K17_05305 [Planococcus sp. SIMBA_143]
MDEDFDIVAAAKDFRAFGRDIIKGELCRVEEDGVMIDGKFFCQVGSPNYYSYFEEI